MNVYGIIPARKNSVRIPGKNIVPLRGKPLIEYTIEAAKQSGVLKRIIVSTDCCKTANIAQECGAQVVMRPESLADGSKHPGIIAAHCIESLEKPDAICWLQPTHPLRKPEWIREAVAMIEEVNCDSVISCVDTSQFHPSIMYELYGNKLTNELEYTRGVDGDVVLRSGDIYLTKTDVLLSLDLYGKDSRALIIPRDRYCNINEPVDLKIAEALL